MFGQSFIYIVVATISLNLIIILKNVGYQFGVLCIMLYDNRENLPLKLKSLIASNETIINISKEYNELFNNEQIQKDNNIQAKSKFFIKLRKGKKNKIDNEE